MKSTPRAVSTCITIVSISATGARRRDASMSRIARAGVTKKSPVIAQSAIRSRAAPSKRRSTRTRPPG
ncbi:hypothetical protein [Acidiphilium acidophilum]|uniref:Uncharacterized protein n=1 Tax=Acidiphilium acidophilum TaxID=76588 RepID=A0AAW9DV78_ACIAO|nr:hypothetical protein [Acidiphilium acidophilum]MDX5932595.1 hypothetical protein [Acidiphilium acidophilum]